MKLGGYQLTARYALSSRTTVYALVGENKITRRGLEGTNRKETGASIGVMHTF